MNRPAHFIRACSLALGLGLLVQPMRAVPPPLLAWSSAQGITGEADVSLAGTFVAAYNLGSSTVTSTTVNDVTFAAFPFPPGIASTATVGNFTFTESTGVLTASDSSGSVSTPFSTLTTGYQTLLSSFGSSSLPGTLTLTMSGLTIGHTYLFQWWSNDSTDRFDPSTLAIAPGDETGVSLAFNPDEASGHLGQFATGTFNAFGTVFEINFIGMDTDPIINAVQLRDVTAVPEPATCAILLGAAALVVAARMRRPESRVRFSDE